MKWFVLFCAVICSTCGAQKTNKDNTISKSDNSDVVYLIEDIGNSFGDIDGKNRHVPSYKLKNPIPFDEAGDGIYFRPDDRKPLDKPQVSIFPFPPV